MTLGLLPSLLFGISVYLFSRSIFLTRRIWIYSPSLCQAQPVDWKRLVRVGRRLRSILGAKKTSGEEWDDALTSLAYELKAGDSLEMAVREAAKGARGEARKFLERSITLYQSGVSMPEALRESSRGSHRASDMAEIVDMGLGTGASMPVLLLNAVDTLRKRRMLQEEARAKMVEARTTAILLVALPWVIVGASIVAGSSPVAVMTGDPRGCAMLYLAGMSWLAGSGWIFGLLRSMAPNGW